MPYQLTSADQQKIVFERNVSGCSRALFIAVGAIFLLVGCGINLLSSGFEFPFALFKIFFPLFGLGAIAVGIFLPKMATTDPEVITFDHNKGAVIIHMTKDGNQTGYIRYDEIEKFDTYVERRSSSSSTSSARSTYSYYYHVFLRKKDGGEWFLSQSETQNAADEILQKLKSSVQTTKIASFLPAPVLTDKISKEEKMDKTVIQWQNKVGIFGPIFLLIFASVFLGIFSMIFTGEFGDIAFFFYMIAGFTIAVFGIILFFAIKKMIKDATTRYAIAVGKSSLEYNEISKSTETIKNMKTIPLPDVYSVAYSFSSISNYSGGGLSILTQKEHLQVQHERDHPLEALKNIFSSKNKPLTLSITALNPIECLQLENWLQELIRKKGGNVL